VTNLCATSHCDRPADAVICPGCIADLVTDLRHLATGGRDARGQERQGLLADLTDTLTRQTAAPKDIGVNARASEKALPYHEAASALTDRVRNELAGWARILIDDNNHLAWPPDDPAEVAGWLARFPALLGMLAPAGDMVDAIWRLTRDVRRTVDVAPERVYLGVCSAEYQTSNNAVILCPEDLYGLPNKATVRCRVCGTEHSMEQRRAELRVAAEDQLATARDCVAAMPALLGGSWSKLEVTIRKWVERGKLTPKPPHPDDPRRRPRYRVGDVMDLASGREREEAS